MRTILDLGAYDGVASKPYVQPDDKWILVDNQQYLKYEYWSVPAIPKDAEYIIMDIMDYDTPAEIVVCSNVLYHVPDPHALLRHLRELTLDTLILRTYFDGFSESGGWNYYGNGKPSHPHKGTAGTIYYRPTIPALRDELDKLGFRNVKTTVSETVTCICKYKEDSCLKVSG